MAKVRRRNKPKLHIWAADLTLTNYPSPKKPWAADTRVRRAKEQPIGGVPSGDLDRRRDRVREDCESCDAVA